MPLRAWAQSMPTAKKRLATATPNSPAGPRAMIDQVIAAASDQRTAAGEAVALEAGDALVVLRQRHQLRLADDVIDAGVGLVAAPLPHLAQDRVGRVGAVHEHQIICCLEPYRFVSL